MVKAWCIWCEAESDSHKLKSGYYWIHQKCAEELMDYGSEVKNVKKMLLGVHQRNKRDTDKINVIIEYINDMDDFRRKWLNTMKLLSPSPERKNEVDKHD